MEAVTMDIKEVAAQLDTTVDNVRYRMRTGEWDLGTVVKSKGGKTYRYKIFRAKFQKFIGER